MKLHKFVLLVSVALGSLLTSACSSTEVATAHQKTTLFGLFTYQPASYAVTNPSSTVITTDEMFGMELPSGNRLQLAWGLISLEDY